MGDPDSTPGSGRSLGEGYGNPLQYSCLENSMDRGTWWATVHGATESDTTEKLTLSLSTGCHWAAELFTPECEATVYGWCRPQGRWLRTHEFRSILQ